MDSVRVLLRSSPPGIAMGPRDAAQGPRAGASENAAGPRCAPEPRVEFDEGIEGVEHVLGIGSKAEHRVHLGALEGMGTPVRTTRPARPEGTGPARRRTRRGRHGPTGRRHGVRGHRHGQEAQAEALPSRRGSKARRLSTCELLVGRELTQFARHRRQHRRPFELSARARLALEHGSQ